MASTENSSESEPIDVEFTPAEPQETASKSSGSQPGWIGLISAGVLSALAGGAIGVVASGTDGRYAQAAEVAVDIAELADYDRTVATQLADIRETLRTTTLRLDQAMERIEQGETSNLEEIETIRADLSTLSARYIALIGGEVEAVPNDETEPEVEAGEEVVIAEGEGADAPLPRPEISLAALMDRLNAIEALDPSGEATPQELARTVASLQERTTQLEETDMRFTEAMEAREQAIAALSAEIDAVEAGLQAAGERSAGIETSVEARDQAVTDLTEDLNALREVVNEQINSFEAAQLTQDEQQLVRRADRVLALSALEAAIQRGDNFSTELEALAIQLEANASVSALRRIADDGAPTLDALKLNLSQLKDEVAQAGIPAQPSGEWAWLGDLLSGVVSMREEGTASGETASRRIDVALELLEGRDLTAAIREIRVIEGPQGEVLADWLASAQRRHQIDQLMTRLRRDVLDGEASE